MDNKNIISMSTNMQDYLQKASIYGIFGIPLTLVGFWIFYMTYTEGVRNSDIGTVVFVGLVLLIIGIHLLGLAGNALQKYLIAKKTYLVVDAEMVSGAYNGKEFNIIISDIVSISVQEGSLGRDINTGVPKKMNVSPLMKFNGETSNYLCIFTNSGRAYYIDTLSSPEIAKNTIDSLIAKNLANAKNA